MKKIITLLLSVIMCFSLSVVASAETQTAEPFDPTKWTVTTVMAEITA